MDLVTGLVPVEAPAVDTCEVRIVDAERVASVRAALPDPELFEALAADVFAVLSDPGRLRLLVCLLEGGELCVCDAAAAAGMSESATSHALRLLPRPRRREGAAGGPHGLLLPDRRARTPAARRRARARGTRAVTHTHDHHTPGAPDAGLSLGAVNERRAQRLWWALGLNLVVVVGQVVFGFVANSLGLLSDAGHNLTDVIALVTSLIAVRWAVRPPSARRSFGNHRGTVLAALANAGSILAITVLILYEAIDRLIHPADGGRRDRRGRRLDRGAVQRARDARAPRGRRTSTSTPPRPDIHTDAATSTCVPRCCTWRATRWRPSGSRSPGS